MRALKVERGDPNALQMDRLDVSGSGSSRSTSTATFRARAIAVWLFAAVVDAALGQEPALIVQPTATLETGDIGGTFFGQPPDPRKTRHYYIAAESTTWDFAPSGRDELHGVPLRPGLAANRQREKVRYFQYTDATFTARVLPTPSLGILGPVLRGVTGEYLAVTFFNRSWRPLSMHPHGVRYDQDSDGSYQKNPGRGAAVGPLGKFTYVWKLDEAAGPRPDEPSSKAWLYHSHVSGDLETNFGLIGCIIVTDPTRVRPNGTPADVDREFATLFMNFDDSGINDEDDDDRIPPAQWELERQRKAASTRRTINGYVYGNLPGLTLNEGERTRWYLLALGSEQDVHVAHWHGLRVIEEGKHRTESVQLLPGAMKVADFTAESPGAWLLECHVAEHMRAGMFALLTINGRDESGIDRTPAGAFLGLPGSARSLQIDRVGESWNRNVTPARRSLVLAGAATAPFEGIDVKVQPIVVGLNGRSVAFRTDDRAVAEEGTATLRVKNADASGVVRGGVLEFELEFDWAEWIERAAAGKSTLPLTIDLGELKHRAEIPIKSL